MTWAIVIVSSVESLSSSLLIAADDGDDVFVGFLTGIWSYICMPFLIAEGFLFSLSSRSISSSDSDSETGFVIFFSVVPDEKWSTDVETSVPRSSRDWIEALSKEEDEEEEDVEEGAVKGFGEWS